MTIDYLHSVKFKKLSEKSRQNIVGAIEIFLRFISDEDYQVDSDVPKNVYEEFTLYVKKNTDKKGNSVGSAVKYAKNAISWYLEDLEQTTVKDNYGSILRVYLAHFPDFQRSPTNAHPSLANLFPDCPYSDTEIIKSIRLVCCWLLLEHDRQRKVLLGDSKVKAIVMQLKHKSLTNPPVSHATFTGKNVKDLNDECRRLYAPIVKAVLDSNDLVLMERLVQSTKHPFNPVMSLEELQIVLSKLVVSGEKVSMELSHKGKQYQQTSIMTLTFRDLLAPSFVEVFAAQCFFASDRVQTSNLDRLKIVDLVNNERGLQGEHAKGRRPIRHQKGLTDVYEPQKLIHNALECYLKILEKCQPMLPIEDQGVALPYLRQKHLKTGSLGLVKEPVSQYFDLLITEGTFTQKSLYDDVTEKDAQPFLWIVKKINENNKLVNEQDRMYGRLRHSNRDSGKPVISRGSIVTNKRISLNPTFIGESRVAMDSGVDTSIKGTTEPSGCNDSKVDSQLTGHSPETKHNIYHDKSNAKEVIESRRKFAVQMGELMVKDAQKMGDLMKDTDVVDLVEAKELLGCTSVSEDFKSLINELDEDIGVTGEINVGSKKIFVANDLTAALITLKISHIEQQFSRLLIDDPDSKSKALKSASEKIYLQAVLNRFPEDIQIAGKTMSRELDFSFADLI